MLEALQQPAARALTPDCSRAGCSCRSRLVEFARSTQLCATRTGILYSTASLQGLRSCASCYLSAIPRKGLRGATPGS